MPLYLLPSSNRHRKVQTHSAPVPLKAHKHLFINRDWATVGGASLGQSHRGFTGNLMEVSS